MALTYGELAAITQKNYIPKLVDNIFNSNALLQRWRKKNYKSESGGTTLMQPLLYATTTATGTYSGTDTLDTSANDQITSAEFSRAHYYANVTIAHTDELQNSGDAQVIDFVRAKVQAAEMSLADKMGTDLFGTYTDTKGLAGIGIAVDSAGTYGGISRTTSSWWASDEDSTTTVLTMAALQAGYGDVTVGNDKPSVGVTTQDIYDSYMNLLTPLQRFVDDDTARGGYTNILFNGMPLVVDSHATSSTLWMLNEKYINLYYHPKDNFRFSPFVKPADQEVVTGKVLWAGQLCCSNCRMQAKFSALTS